MIDFESILNQILLRCGVFTFFGMISKLSLPSPSSKRQFESNQAHSPRSPTKLPAFPSLDLGPLEPFLQPNFDVTSFTKQESSLNLQFFKTHLETVERAISSHVVTHENSLLGTLEFVTSLKREMNRTKLDSLSLSNSMHRVELDFNEPLERLRNTHQSLNNAHQTVSVLRALSWYLNARKKLKPLSTQERNGGKETARAAQLLGEMEELVLIPGSVLKQIKIVEADLKWIKELGARIRADAQICLETSVVQLNHGEMNLAIQAFSSLNMLDDRISSCVNVFVMKEFTLEIRDVLKDTTIGVQVRIDGLLERSLRTWAMRVWNLSRVLQRAKFTQFPTLFDSFFNKMCTVLEQELKTTNRETRDSLIGEYPRLRRSALDVLVRLKRATTTTTMSGTGAAAHASIGGEKETRHLMQALHPYLGEFLRRSLERLTNPIHMMFPSSALELKPLPTMNDVNTLSMLIQKELSGAATTATAMGGMDLELLRAIGKTCAMALNLFCDKATATNTTPRGSQPNPPFRGLSLVSLSMKKKQSTSSLRSPLQEHHANLVHLLFALSTKVKEYMTHFQERLPLSEVENHDNEDSHNEDDDDDENNDDDAEQSNSITSSSKSVTDPFENLKVALESLDKLQADLILDYFGENGEFCFQALDDILVEVNHTSSNYSAVTSGAEDSFQITSFSVPFQRACTVLVEEHFSKLPSAVGDPISKSLQTRLAYRFGMRVCSIRPFSPQGRLYCVKEMSLVFAALGQLTPKEKSGVWSEYHHGLELLISQEEVTSLHGLPKPMVWQYYLKSLNYSPERNLNLSQYLAEIEFQSPESIWEKYVLPCLSAEEVQYISSIECNS